MSPPRTVLVLNCGSSSLKYAVVEPDSGRLLVDGIVERMRDELGDTAPAIATGGLAELIAPHARTIEKVDPLLTLDGLRLVWDRNR